MRRVQCPKGTLSAGKGMLYACAAQPVTGNGQIILANECVFWAGVMTFA